MLRVDTCNTSSRTLESSQDKAMVVAEIFLAQHRETKLHSVVSVHNFPHPNTSDGCPITMHWNGYCRSIAKSRSGNRLVLVICDYATRYPEVRPLKTVDADQVK